jgi:hypothetical protein
VPRPGDDNEVDIANDIRRAVPGVDLCKRVGADNEVELIVAAQ